MRVMVVHSRYRSSAPSGENHVVDQETAALADAGHRVDLFQRHSDDIAGWPLRQKAALPALSVANPPVRRALEDRLREWRPDVVHVHNTFPLLSPSVLRACWSARVPVVTTLHNYKLLCASGDFFRDGHPCHACAAGAGLPAVSHGCYRGSRAATAAVAAGTRANRHAWRTLVSAHLFISAAQRDLMAGLGLAPDRVFVKHNFVEVPAVVTAPVRHRVAYVGRLDAAKGVPFLMQVWDRFQDRHPASGLGLSIAGAGPLEREVRAWASRRPSVEVHGHLPRERVALLVAGSRAAVVPSQWEETFGLVAVEAMAMGTPPLAPARGSFPELISDGRDGRLYRPDDPGALVTVLEEVDRRPEQLARMGHHARSTVAARFGRAAGVRRLEEVYRFAVDRPAFAPRSPDGPGELAAPRRATGT